MDGTRRPGRDIPIIGARAIKAVDMNNRAPRIVMHPLDLRRRERRGCLLYTSLASRVIHRECDPKGGLRIATGFHRIVVYGEDTGQGRDIGAGVEYGLPGQAKPAHVARVNLAEPQIDRVACCHITPRCGDGIGGTGLAGGLPPAVDVESELLAAALGLDDGQHRLGCYAGCALRSQGK